VAKSHPVMIARIEGSGLPYTHDKNVISEIITGTFNKRYAVHVHPFRAPHDRESPLSYMDDLKKQLYEGSNVFSLA